jgi:hypothetical protein
MFGRTAGAAELATGAVDDDARQDEDHADDAEQVRQMLRAEVLVPMCGVGIGRQVDGDVEGQGPDHHDQSEAAEIRDDPSFGDDAATSFYR